MCLEARAVAVSWLLSKKHPLLLLRLEPAVASDLAGRKRETCMCQVWIMHLDLTLYRNSVNDELRMPGRCLWPIIVNVKMSKCVTSANTPDTISKICVYTFADKRRRWVALFVSMAHVLQSKHIHVHIFNQRCSSSFKTHSIIFRSWTGCCSPERSHHHHTASERQVPACRPAGRHE